MCCKSQIAYVPCSQLCWRPWSQAYFLFLKRRATGVALLMSRWSIDVLLATHATFPSITLNRHNGPETSTASSSLSVHDVHKAMNFAHKFRTPMERNLYEISTYFFSWLNVCLSVCTPLLQRKICMHHQHHTSLWIWIPSCHALHAFRHVLHLAHF